MALRRRSTLRVSAARRAPSCTGSKPGFPPGPLETQSLQDRRSLCTSERRPGEDPVGAHPVIHREVVAVPGEILLAGGDKIRQCTQPDNLKSYVGEAAAASRLRSSRARKGPGR